MSKWKCTKCKNPSKRMTSTNYMPQDDIYDSKTGEFLESGRGKEYGDSLNKEFDNGCWCADCGEEMRKE